MEEDPKQVKGGEFFNMTKRDLLGSTTLGITAAIIASVFYVTFYIGKAGAVPEPKVTICHATGSETNPYTQNIVSANAIGGHFDNPGTPKAGHEADLLLEGEVNCPAPVPTVEPTPTEEVSPTPEVDVTPTATPSATVTETPNTGGGSDGRSDGKSDGLCSKPPCSQPVVVPNSSPNTGRAS